MTGSVFDRIVEVLEAAADYDPNTTSEPKALLWPDAERHWEAIIPLLRERLRIVSFGTFDAEARQGPGYWLRCVVAGTIPLDDAPTGGVPIIYLPGISRDTLRTGDLIPPELAPLGAIQQRCQWIIHPNGKDWTVRALLSNKQRGLGLNIAADPPTAAALGAGLRKLCEQRSSRLESKHIDVDFLNHLLNPDPVRSLLDWLDDPTEMRLRLSAAGWTAFRQQCETDFGFNPETQGEIEGARRLGEGEGQWEMAWIRFRENPKEFPGIPDRLRQAQPGELLPPNPGSWPGRADDEEDRLRLALKRLAHQTPADARASLAELETEHGVRRGYVWAELGRTPLALALKHLAKVADLTSTGPAGSSVEAIAEWYTATGWRADGAVLDALAEVTRRVDGKAVETAIETVYKPWADSCARALQTAIGPLVNGATYAAAPPPLQQSGEVIVFVDGLRLDVAHRLSERLAGSELKSELTTSLAALPTVTATAKPAVVPIDQRLLTAGTGLAARRAPDGPAAEVRVLRKLMAAANVPVLGPGDLGDPTGVAWTETGTLDHRGHDVGLQLASEVNDEVHGIANRVDELLRHGWQRVTIVTDHGWLLMPGGLPKNEDLPVAVTETKKGRCARLKDGAAGFDSTVPWHWDPDVRIAVAPGISCFEANQTYEHGGVSPQECVVPRLTVERGAGATKGAAIVGLKWRGLTLTVDFSGLPDGTKIDLRVAAGDPGSSIAAGPVPVKAGAGKVVLYVGDEDFEGRQSYLVLLAADGLLLLQRETTVGENR